MSSPTKMIYYFGKTRTDGTGVSKQILGGKGANLADMTSIGLPVPPGFTITTEVCGDYYKSGQTNARRLDGRSQKERGHAGSGTGQEVWRRQKPAATVGALGAAVSMPGMMNTILEPGAQRRLDRWLGQGDQQRTLCLRRLSPADQYVRRCGDERRSRALRRSLRQDQEEVQHDQEDTQVPAEGLKELCDAYKALYKKHTGEDFPQDPMQQLGKAVEAVFKSWMTNKAVKYREIENIRGLLGTAVNCQSMVYGNMGDDSGTGVAFTRNPNTGENKFFGEFLVNAQGEDVVAGIRTPQPTEEMSKWNAKVYEELMVIKDKLEKHYKDMQDIEFTIEKGTLFMLQTRNGKRTGMAAVRLACEMVKEGLIDEKTAVLRVPAGDLTQLLLPSFQTAAWEKVTKIARGLPASPGAAVGKLAFTAEDAKARATAGEKVILIRKETSPEDVDGMHAAAGILTSTGGMTSHAAVVARGWGRCCVAGAVWCRHRCQSQEGHHRWQDLR